MATRRAAKTVIDWAALSDRLGASRRDVFRQVKGPVDECLSRVNKHPEEMPKIDFEYYKSRMADPAMAEEFEKLFGQLKVPYPKDVGSMLPGVADQSKQIAKQIVDQQAGYNRSIKRFNEYLAVIDSIPALDELTMDMLAQYLPDSVHHPETRPTLWPHTPEAQPINSPELLNYGNKRF